MIDDSEYFLKAQFYVNHKGKALRQEAKLGHGTDGAVWPTASQTAVKALYIERTYQNEIAAYQRLTERNVEQIHGFNVPQLIGHDDQLLVIEMTIVQPPFLLDFGKAYVDRPPPYWNDQQLMANAYKEWQTLFEDRWQEVAALLGAMQSLGIYYVDPRPGNIVF